MHISKLSYMERGYPTSLLDIASPPKELFVLGNLPKDKPYVSIVGSRKVTDYGREVTYRLSYDLAKAGVVIVSGLALGIDGIAHQAALDAGGLTVAILGTAIDHIYPASHRNLAIDILKHKGAIVSELEKTADEHPGIFPARNRIIAGLSSATIITEAAASSGALITANFALEQGKQVMAVPGNITSLQSAGPNNLLKSGAIPVTDAADVLAALNFESNEVAALPVKAKSKEEALILELLTQGVNTSHDLIEHSQLSASQFANIISLMEITGKVRNLGAGTWMAR